MNFRPIYDRILVKVIDEADSSILIYKNPDKELIKGKVVLAGLGKHSKSGIFIKNPVKKGDTILFFKSKGENFRIDDEDLLGMNGIVDVEGIIA